MLWVLLLALQICWVSTSQCRNRFGEYYPQEMFKRAMCASAYVMDPSEFPGKTLPFHYDSQTHELVNASDPSDRVIADPSDPRLKNTFLNSKFADNWAEICKAADICCQKMISDPPSQGTGHCPRTWDGMSCWSDTPGDEVASQPCEDRLYLFAKKPTCTRYVKKVCWTNGTWFRNSGREPSDYSGCFALEETKTKTYVHIGAFSCSIALLIPAIIIFIVYRQLQVIRVLIHLNLFIALAMNGIMVIAFEAHVIHSELKEKETVIDKNELGCKMLSVAVKYFRLTTYTWMLCEGFHLHKLFIAAFTDQKKVWMFYVAGWGFPVLVVGIYAVLRAFYADHSCWAFSSGAFDWVVNGPMVLTLLVNVVFLFNISIVLITNLRKSGSSHKYSRAARGTLLLVPLFGIHLVFIIYSPKFQSCLSRDIFIYAKYLIDGLQGFVVSILFCFLNKEVILALRRTFYRLRQKQEVEAQRSRRLTSDTSLSTRTSVVTASSATEQVPLNTSDRKESDR